MPETPSITSSEQNFFRYPTGSFRQRRRRGDGGGGRRKAVCVIGAGIAGLAAAYELRRAGHDVVVVERDRRVGGRICTWHVGGLSGEFGPMRIPPNHRGTMHYVRGLKLKTGLFVQHNPAGWYRLRNQQVRIANWRDLIPFYGGNPRYLFPSLAFDKTETDAEKLMQQILQLAKQILVGDEYWRIFNGSLGPAGLTLAAMSLQQLTRGMLADIAGWGGSWLTPLQGTGHPPPLRWVSDMGWEFIGRSTGSIWEERMSALEACVEDVFVHGGNRLRLVDGMDALPLKLQAQLENSGVPINLRSRVTAIELEPMDDRVRLFTDRGEVKAGTEAGFQYVVCAVPASATARISFTPSLDPAKYEALTNLTYQNAAKSLILVRKRRWEDKPDEIFGGASYTDLPIQQIWYPSDNARPIGRRDDPEDEDQPLRVTRLQDTGAGRQWDISALGYGPADPDPDAWQRSAILTGAYMTGINAERFTSLSRHERDDEVINCLNLIHPGIRDDVDDIKHCCWIEQRTPGGGAWTIFGPGIHDRYLDKLCQPHPMTHPQVFFAGEHLCVLHGWMQSAIQSALEAALAVMDSP